MAELKIFSDAVDALGKLVGAVRSVAAIPRAERDFIREVIEDTFQLLDSALNMVTFRLSDVLASTDGGLLDEVRRLDHVDDWYRVERDFRMCRSLQVALRELDSFGGRWRAEIGARDWDTVEAQLEQLLRHEGTLADAISYGLASLAQSAASAGSDAGAAARVRADVGRLRDSLREVRRTLIRQEAELIGLV